jgi:hypothetical protein
VGRSWHSTTELLPLSVKSAIYLIPNYLHETTATAKVSEIQARPEESALPTLRFGTFLGEKAFQPHYTISSLHPRRKTGEMGEMGEVEW